MKRFISVFGAICMIFLLSSCNDVQKTTSVKERQINWFKGVEINAFLQNVKDKISSDYEMEQQARYEDKTNNIASLVISGKKTDVKFTFYVDYNRETKMVGDMFLFVTNPEIKDYSTLNDDFNTIICSIITTIDPTISDIDNLNNKIKTEYEQGIQSGKGYVYQLFGDVNLSITNSDALIKKNTQ